MIRDPNRPITALHYMPETVDDVNLCGCNFRKDFLCFMAAELIHPDSIVTHDADTPGIVIANTWTHTDMHGLYTREWFEADLRASMKGFAKFIADEYLPFEPVRLKPAESAYALAVYNFMGDEFPFDLRFLGEFRSSIVVQNEAGETGFSPGFRYTIATKIKADPERDREVGVAKDFSEIFDD